MSEKLSVHETKMNKTIDNLLGELDSIRAGRANAAVLEKIMVNYYGSPTKISGLATVTTPEARLLVIQPWDKSLLKEIEKAIQASDLGINPQNDGVVIRLNFPQLTEDRRKELSKQASKKGEEAKVAIRSIRRDAIEKFKAEQKKSEISEDDLKVLEKDTQDLHDKFIKEVDLIVSKKEKEIMQV